MTICAYKPCSMPFEPKKPWQAFCSPVCRNKFHAIKRQKAVEYVRTKKVKL